MNIGLDMDGVLTDIRGFTLKHATPFFLKKYNREVADDNPYDVREIFQCSDREFVSYWKRYLFKYAVFEPARLGAKNVIDKLREEGHLIYIISKRVFACRADIWGKLMRAVVKNWLRRNGILYDGIVFCDHGVADSKRDACLDKQIDVLVDDEPVNVYAVAPIAKVICYDLNYNKDCEGDNIFRARDFDEIYELISGMA